MSSWLVRLASSARQLWYARLLLDDASALSGAGASAAPTVLALLPRLWQETAGWTLLFSALLWLVVPRLLAAAAPAWWASQSPRERRYASATLAALPHHAIVVAVGAHALASFPVVPHSVVAVVPISIAYFNADCSAALPDALYGEPAARRQALEYLLHHGLAYVLAAGLLAAGPQTLRWVPHIYICEASTLFFSAAWAARRLRSGAAGPLEAAFAALFFATRVVNLPAMLAALLLRGERDALGGAGVAALAAVVGMQLFWAAAICGKMRRQRGGGGGGGGGGGAAAAVDVPAKEAAVTAARRATRRSGAAASPARRRPRLAAP